MKRLVVQGRNCRGKGRAGDSPNRTGMASKLADANLAVSARRHAASVAFIALLCTVSLIAVGCRSKEQLPEVGSKINVTGTYDSYTQTPVMISMTDGAVVVKKAAPKKPAAPVHHTPARKK